MTFLTPLASRLPAWTPDRARCFQRWLRPLLRWLLIWAFFYLLLMLASYADFLRQGKSPNLLRMIWLNLAYMFPLVLFNWVLAVYVEHRHDAVESLRAVLKWAVVAVALGFGLMLLSSAAFMAWRTPGAKRSWLEHLAQRSHQDNLVDLMLIVGALVFQLAWSMWVRAQEQREAMQRTQTDNLRLRLSLLQGQLEPHFLFNTLNSISALVRASARDQALSALSRVSELLRYALRASQQEWVSVQGELNFVRDYLELQQLRFGDSLQLDWQVQARDWHQAACPPLLFQPLVENAVRHGLEAFEGAGQITLQLTAEAGRIHLRLTNPIGDHGTGVQGHGVGLTATRERLHMLYGAEAGVVVHREQGVFRLELHLPWRDLDD